MEQIIQEILGTELTAWNALFKLILSLILGAMIGVERSRRGQVAGMRTFSLICMGATLAMLVSIFIPQEYLGLKNGDPGRIAAQVVSGIGFLGAGAIIQMKGNVRGLTTAAGIWMTACLGLAIGAGMYVIAIVAAVLILVVFRLLDMVENYVFRGAEQKVVRVKYAGIVTDLAPYRSCFKQYHVHISEEFLRYDYVNDYTIVNYMVRTHTQTDMTALFRAIHETGPILSVTLSNEMNN